MITQTDCRSMEANQEMIQVEIINATNSAVADNGNKDNEEEQVVVVEETSAPKVREPPPFLLKVYDMVQNPEFDSIISWGANGTSFIIWDVHKFAAEVLTKYFKHSNFTSFICQLNTYCFKKINWDRHEFQNEWFQKGKKRWLKYINRRNQIPKHPQQQFTEPAPAVELIPSKMVKEVENLSQQQSDLKGEIAKLKERYEKQEQQMDTLQKRGQLAALKRQKIVELMNQAVLKLKKELYGDGEVSKRQGLDLETEGEEKGIEEIPNTIRPSIQSNTKNTCLGLVDANASKYKLLEMELMEEEDMNIGGENLSEDELLHSHLVIEMEDLINGPSDWVEFRKQLTSRKAKKSLEKV